MKINTTQSQSWGDVRKTKKPDRSLWPLDDTEANKCINSPKSISKLQKKTLFKDKNQIVGLTPENNNGNGREEDFLPLLWSDGHAGVL